MDFCKPAENGQTALLIHRVLEGGWTALGKDCGIGHIGTHSFRHSYRMWIDAIGTPIGVQQKLMRHSDIRTTMNIYGDAESGDMRRVNGKIAELAFSLQ